MDTEDHNLGIYRILFIIKGILTLLFGLLPILYIILGIFVFQKGDISFENSQIGGTFLVIIGTIAFFFLALLGILTLLTAKYLGEKRNYDFIFVMAIINCLTGILGIILGIFTILELNKPHVKRLFGKRA